MFSVQGGFHKGNRVVFQTTRIARLFRYPVLICIHSERTFEASGFCSHPETDGVYLAEVIN